MDLLQRLILAQRRIAHTVLEEELQFLPAGIGRGAAMTRYGEGAAGIGIFQRCRPVFISQPAFQQAGHEPIARAQHVENVDRKAGTGQAVIQTFRNRPIKRHSAHRAALANQRC